jgi:cysteinyl-tRNA synthetase
LQGLKEAKQNVLDWKNIIANVEHRDIEIIPSQDLASALVDDLNTPEAIFLLHRKAKLAARNSSIAAELYSDLVFLGILKDWRDGDAEVLKVLENSQELSPEHALSKQQQKEKISERASVVLYTLDPTINTVAVSASVATTLSTIFAPGEKITTTIPWIKYGPPYISSSDMWFIKEKIGIEELNCRIENRLVARKAKNFAESDRIRDELAAMGVVLKDTKDGTTWEIAR